jgi:hypothetical protein
LGRSSTWFERVCRFWRPGPQGGQNQQRGSLYSALYGSRGSAYRGRLHEAIGSRQKTTQPSPYYRHRSHPWHGIPDGGQTAHGVVAVAHSLRVRPADVLRRPRRPAHGPGRRREWRSTRYLRDHGISPRTRRCPASPIRWKCSASTAGRKCWKRWRPPWPIIARRLCRRPGSPRPHDEWGVCLSNLLQRNGFFAYPETAHAGA